MDDWAAFEAASSRPEPTVLRTRLGRISSGDLERRLTDQGFRLTRKDGLPGFFEVQEGPRPVSMTLEHWLGLFYVQQASTGVAAPLLDPQPGERVLDLCAAPGGKTTHIAERMNDRGCLVAAEISEPRIRGLLGNVYRLGHTNVLVVAGDGRHFPEGALFDRVLVDAPCSGEGTLRRSGGRAPRQSASFAGYVAGAQRALLEKAIHVTRPGGTILYATCTFAPEENEAVVHDLLQYHPVAVDPIEMPCPSAPGVTSFGDARYDDSLSGAARIYPHHLDSGGLFMARLTRLEGDAPRVFSVGAGPIAGRPSEILTDAAPGADGAAAWSPVPLDFPDEDAPGDRAAEGDSSRDDDTRNGAARVEAARGDLEDRFGIPGSVFGDHGWAHRGGRLWIHSLSEWPLDHWLARTGPDRPWRPISVGFRAVDFDSRERPRPTNDFLRWFGGALSARVCDVTPDELALLAARSPIPREGDLRGPVAIRCEGDVIGRAAATAEGLKSEIPKARSADLLRSLERT